MSCSISSSGRILNFFSRLEPQNVQVLFEQPIVACRSRLCASDGGRKTGSTYLKVAHHWFKVLEKKDNLYFCLPLLSIVYN